MPPICTLKDELLAKPLAIFYHHVVVVFKPQRLNQQMFIEFYGLPLGRLFCFSVVCVCCSFSCVFSHSFTGCCVYSQLSLALHLGPLAVGNLLLLPFIPLLLYVPSPFFSVFLFMFCSTVLHSASEFILIAFIKGQGNYTSYGVDRMRLQVL